MTRTDFLVIGIDPGKTGAYAVLAYNRAFVWDLDLDLLIGHIRLWKLERRDQKIRVVIERQQSFPGSKRGQIASFKLGFNYGELLGICRVLDIHVTEVTPRTWKKRLELIKQDKEASRRLALSLFPECKDELQRKMDHGRAEALLIAHYGRATLEA